MDFQFFVEKIPWAIDFINKFIPQDKYKCPLCGKKLITNGHMQGSIEDGDAFRIWKCTDPRCNNRIKQPFNSQTNSWVPMD